MNSVSKNRLARGPWLLLFMAMAISCLAQLATPPSDQAAVAAFHDTLFRSSLDRDGFGRSAIDLYWAADGLGVSTGDAKAFHAKLSALYGEIAGTHVARAELTASGWKITRPSAEFVLASGQPYEVLLIASNSTNHVQTFRAVLAGDVNGWSQTVELARGESVGLCPRIVSSAIGPLHAAIELHGTTASQIVLTGEVRQPVRLHVRVLDNSGNPTPARIYLHGADGRSYTPADSFDHIMWMTGEHFFYSPGTVDVVLPAGRADIEVRKGFEYRPVLRQLDLVPGGAGDLEIRLQWLRDMTKAGWFGGDNHIHNNYTGEQWSTPGNARLVIAAEGLHVGNMMVSNGTGDDIHDERYFEGKLNALSTPDELLDWNQEMRSWSYGHLVLLRLKRLVRPIYTGFPGTPHWEDYPSNYQQAEQAHQQNGIVIYAHPALRFDDYPTGSLAGEAVAEVALGALDGFEIFCSHDEPSMEMWYRFLNLGFHLGISAGSDAFLNNHFAFLAGGERVYVYTGKKLAYSRWIDGVKNGHAFATVGPLLTFTVDGRIAGSELRFAGAQPALPVHVSAISSIPMTRIEIVVNGRVAATASSVNPAGHLHWSGAISVPKSSWVAARVWGPDNERVSNGPSRWSQRRSPSVALLAHSGPVYVSVSNQPVFSAADRDYCLHWIDALTARIRKDGRFASDAHRNEVLAFFARARRVYEYMGGSGEGDHQ